MYSISWLFSLMIPMVLHMILSEVAVILVGQSADATLCTTVAAVLVIPIAGWMFYRDRRNGNSEETVKADNQYRNHSEHSQNTDCRNIIFGKRQILFSIFCFLAGGILNMAWSRILNLMQVHEIFSNSTQEALLSAEIVLQIVGLGILVPVAEELIFRGLIYNRMKKMLKCRPSIFLSALIFALYHGNPIQMIFSFPMALALTAVYEQGKLFVFPILFHMGANLAAVFANFFA